MFLSATNWGTNTFTSAKIFSFPSGYALATVFASGWPSASFMLNVSNFNLSLIPMPFSITNFSHLPNGSFQFTFTNSTGLTFIALGTADPGTPLTNWNLLGNVTEISSGTYQYTDLQAATNGIRFYSVHSQ